MPLTGKSLKVHGTFYKDVNIHGDIVFLYMFWMDKLVQIVTIKELGWGEMFKGLKYFNSAKFCNLYIPCSN